MAALQRCTRSLFRRNGLLNGLRAYTMTSSNHPANLTVDDLGKLYKVDKNTVEVLNYKQLMPIQFTDLLKTLDECVWMCRSPLLEAINCIKQQVNPTSPMLRIMLWGRFGTGKTVTLNQLLHYGFDEGFVIVHLPTTLRWNRLIKEVQMSSYKPGRVDLPDYAVEILQNFKHQNQPLWKTLSELKTERDYNWSKVEKTVAGRPLTDIVEMGLTARFLASDCVGALFKELRRHANEGSIKLMVAIDRANSLYAGKTIHQKPDFSRVKAGELSLVVHTKNLFRTNWKNGVCVLVGDEAEFSKNRRDTTTIKLFTPLEMFGEEGFDDIEPFIPIETGIYTKEEADVIYDYFFEMNWLTKAKSPEARKQLYHLSAYNPFNYERLCAFN
ncbi:Deoxyhypusine hydroxylase [Aphelenchoides bicaudatus]|nr:Deoxyhypusine hydroxylase [Aphelenchoides bicaudatus]